MRPQDIDRFFTRLAKKFDHKAILLLTGGGAGILEGVQRVTRDLDFQITLADKSAARQDLFAKAARETALETGILAQYDSAIEGWSSIAWPAARPKSRRYRKFGSLEVRILDPLWWSVGKLARALSSDLSDVVTVFRHTRMKADAVARAWGKALGRSPMSSAQPLFKQQVLYFFKTHAKSLWGPRADPEKLSQLFLASARNTRRD